MRPTDAWIPAFAGMTGPGTGRRLRETWIPASAGMTVPKPRAQAATAKAMGWPDTMGSTKG